MFDPPRTYAAIPGPSISSHLLWYKAPDQALHWFGGEIPVALLAVSSLVDQAEC